MIRRAGHCRLLPLLCRLASRSGLAALWARPRAALHAADKPAGGRAHDTSCGLPEIRAMTPMAA
jgi:hypothetical protein